MPTIAEIIEAKRDGARLADPEIDRFVAGLASGDVTDGQACAMAMAVFFRDLDAAELGRWTSAMAASGDQMRWPADPARPLLDKHSCGGVGDKVSLVLAPLLAAAGARVPMISGRGLAHTGGTLDKLEALPGLSTQLSPERLAEVLDEVGCFIAAATGRLCPADARLYALRDTSATVPSAALIASSIMSKKLAEGPDVLILDVTYGTAAFMGDLDAAEDLARRMLAAATGGGLRAAAALAPMSAPRGRSAGNGPEVAEALEILSGAGPTDVRELSLDYAHAATRLAGMAMSREGLAELLDNGAANDKFAEMALAQGADEALMLPLPRSVVGVYAPASGVVGAIDAMAIGRAAHCAGAGRSRPDEPVDPTAGASWFVDVGTEVRSGELIAEVMGAFEAKLAQASSLLAGAFALDVEPVRVPQLRWVEP